MSSPEKFRYRLDTSRYGVGRIVKWRPKLVAAFWILAAATGAAQALGYATATIAIGISTLIFAAVLWSSRRESAEIEGLPLVGEFEPLLGGLNIRFGRGKTRLKAWHSFDTIAYDPNEGLLTLVPEFGFAISLTRAEVANLDRLAQVIAHFARVDYETSIEDDAPIAEPAPLARG